MHVQFIDDSEVSLHFKFIQLMDGVIFKFVAYLFAFYIKDKDYNDKF